MKKLIFILMLFITFPLFAQDFIGKWDYTITYETGGIQTGLIVINKSTIVIDDTNHTYSVKDGFFFIDNMGYYYEIKDDILILTPAFGGLRHIIKMKRIK